MNTYNPINRAISAAWSELSSSEAQQFYADRAWSDTLTTWAALSNLCQVAIQLGAFCRCVVEDWLQVPQQPQAQLALQPVKIAGYLPEMSSSSKPVLITPPPAAPDAPAAAPGGTGQMGGRLSRCKNHPRK
jgi:hypothetical protein